MHSENYLTSFLVTPALDVACFEKIQNYHADCYVVDLEDSVPENKKNNGRELARHLFNSNESKVNSIRINSIRTQDGIKDILLLLDLVRMPEIIMVPMIESSGDINLLKSILSASSQIPKIFSVIETPSGLINIKDIARSSNGLIFGSADFAAAMGTEISSESSRYARTILTTTASAFGIPAFDSPCFNLTEQEELIVECQYAKEIGFHGKIAIHPSQLDVINKLFSPSLKQTEWAQKIVASFNKSEKNIEKLDGKMIGPPFLKLAKKILLANR